MTRYDLNDQQPKPPKEPRAGARIAFIAVFTILAVFGMQALRWHFYPSQIPASISESSPKATPTVVPAEPPQEPEKTTAELFKQLDDQMTAKQYEGADSTITDLLDRVNARSLTGVSLLLKQGAARMEFASSEDTQKAYREALFGLENHYGASDPRVLPALQGLIASSEESDNNDYKLGLELAQRYDSIAKTSPLATTDSTVDEVAAAGYISEAQKRADAKKEDCLCSELNQSIKDAGERYGERSYVVVLLSLKQAELDDQDPLDNADASKPATVATTPAVTAPSVSAAGPKPVDSAAAVPTNTTSVGDLSTTAQGASNDLDAAKSVDSDADNSATTVGEAQLQTDLAIIEQRFGPVDYRLEPVLRRLIAISDEQGNHETADVLIARLGLLRPRAL